MKISETIVGTKKYLLKTKKNKIRKLNRLNVKTSVLVWAILGVIFASTNALGTVVMSSDVPKIIPDDDPAGISSTLDFPSMIIGDVDLILTITHNSVLDLHIELQSPAGTTAVLLLDGWSEGGILTGMGYPNPNFLNTHFDDESKTSLHEVKAPYTGSFNIDRSDMPGNDNMSFFYGQDAGGTWTLFVSDGAEWDEGTLVEWGLEIVPEPATVMLLGLGSLALLKMPRIKI